MVSRSRRILVVVIGVLLVIGVGWYASRPPRKLTFNERLTTPLLGINQSVLREVDLSVGNESFHDIDLAVTQGDSVAVKGKLTIHFEEVGAPPRSDTECDLLIKCAPAGSPEAVWEKLGDKPGVRLKCIDDLTTLRKHLEAVKRSKAGALPEWNQRPRAVTVDTKWRIREKQFPPGDYETRLYLIINVRNTEIQAVHHYGSGRLRVLPKPSEPPSSSPTRVSAIK